jgi:plastocyanin
MKDDKEYGQGDTTIDNNKLSMRRGFASDAPNGIYMVIYKACWPDQSCHDGSFEFAVDRSKASGYENMQNKKEVTIHMSEIMFAPKNILISPGTKVTWVNDEEVEHYVNTDSHPAHTYYPIQNSRSLVKGAGYSATFDKPGAYPYHCSSHANTMIGNIIVLQ